MNHYEFVEKHGITSQAVRVRKRADGLNDTGNQIHWLVTLLKDGKAESFFFSHGFNWLPEGRNAHPQQYGFEQYPGEFRELRNSMHRLNEYGKRRLTEAKYHHPDTVSVLHSLHMDSVIAEDTTDMWDFFEQFGIEPTKEDARGYELMQHNIEKIKALLGETVYEEFLALEEE